MNDLREEYKSIVLQACRVGVKLGGMSAAFEEFVIDNVDEIVGNLTDADFEHLVLHGTIPVRDIENNEEYRKFLEKETRGINMMQSDELTATERGKLQEYCSILDQLRAKYKQREWHL